MDWVLLIVIAGPMLVSLGSIGMEMTMAEARVRLYGPMVYAAAIVTLCWLWDIDLGLAGVH